MSCPRSLVSPVARAVASAVASSVSEIAPGSSPELWTPAQITTALWLDAADTATITDAGAGAVSAWADKSGNTRDFSQATAGSRPTTGVTTLNSLNTIQFAADFLISDDSASVWEFLHNSTGHSVFAVASPGATANPNTLYGLYGTNRGSVSFKGVYFRYDDRLAGSYNDAGVYANLLGTGGGGIQTVAMSDNDVWPAQSATLISLLNDPTEAAASRSLQWYDGAPSGTDTSATTTSTIPTGAPASTLEIGAVGNAVWPFTGEIAEFIIVSGVVDTANRQLIEGYLAWKWGLEANLPSGHPYKDAAPILTQRILEDGTTRLLEDGTVRLLE